MKGNLLSTPKSNLYLFGRYHHAFKGAIEDEKSAQSELNTYLKGIHVIQNSKMQYQLQFQQQKYKYYGYSQPLPDHVFSQSYPMLGVSFHWNTPTENPFSYHFQTSFHHLSDAFSRKETIFFAQLKPRFALSENTHLLVNSQWYLSEQGSSSVQKNQSIDIIPSISFTNENISVVAGVHINFFQHVSFLEEKENQFFLFPYAHLKWYLGEGLILQGELDGAYLPNSQKQLIEKNPYLNSRFDLMPTQNNLKSQVALVYSSKSLSVRFFGKFTLEKDKPFFINTSQDAAFHVFYLNSPFSTLEIGVFGHYKLKKVNITMGMNHWIYRWDQQMMKIPWHLPTWKAHLNAHFQLTKHLFAQGQFNYLTGIQALNPNTSQVVLLKAIPEMNLEVTYLFNTHFEFFIKANNLLSQSYQRYLFYQLRTLHGIIGIKLKL